MDDADAVAGLTRLGLTTYEARVFVGLQRLGGGTAREVSEVAEVPRSQVYGAAEGLEDRGLVETRQSRPTVYRPVELEVARQRLLDRLAETGAETFAHLASVRESTDGREQSEDIWTVNGANAVAARAASLAGEARQRLVYSVDDTDLLEEGVTEALRDAAGRGVRTVLASADASVRAAAPEGVETHAVPPEPSPEVRPGRVLLADDDTILLSVFSTATRGGDVEEVAFWSEGSTFAAVLVEFGEDRLADPFGSESNG